MEQRIFVEYTPFAQPRPRISKFGTYDPAAKKKKELGFLIKQQWKDNLIDGPVELSLRFYMPIPKSLSKKKQAALVDQPHIKKPDIDNLIKAVIDTMSGIVIKDDKIIWKIKAEKFYSQFVGIEILINL